MHSCIVFIATDFKFKLKCYHYWSCTNLQCCCIVVLLCSLAYSLGWCYLWNPSGHCCIRLFSGRVPENNLILSETLLEKFYDLEPFKSLSFKINFPNPSKPPVVPPQKCQRFVQRLRETLFPEGNKLSVTLPIYPLRYCWLAGNESKKFHNEIKGLHVFFFTY